jgi:hypothetical protein
MRFDPESINDLARTLAALAFDEIPRLQGGVSSQGLVPTDASDACFAIASVVLEKTIITNRTMPGDVSVRLAATAVKEYETLLQKSRDPKELLVEAMSLSKTGFQAQYKKNKVSLEGAWNLARDQGTDPFGSMAMIGLQYCKHVAKSSVQAPDALAAMQMELDVFVARIRAAIEDAQPNGPQTPV